MIDNQSSKKIPHHFFKDDEGFSLIELAAVIAILSVLGSFGIGNITRWMKLSKIDQATALLSSSLVECLESTRAGIDPTKTAPPSDVIDNNRLESVAYKIKDSKDKCSQFFITPKDSDEKVLFEMGYQITLNNQVTKIATPADNQSSLSRCKRWAGPNCGATEEQKKKWEEDRLLAERERDCKDAYSEWLNEPPPPGRTGSFNTWDSTKKTCTKQVWVCDGDEKLGGEEALEKCKLDKQGAECRKNIKKLEEASPPTNGIFDNVESCPDGEKYYFCQGKEQDNEVKMKKCQDDFNSDKCGVIYSEKAKTLYSGSWGPSPTDEYGNKVQGPPPCGNIAYMCGGDFTYDEDEYKKYDCYNPAGGGGGGGGGGGDPKSAKRENCLSGNSTKIATKIRKFCKDGGGVPPTYLDNQVPGHGYCGSFDSCMGN